MFGPLAALVLLGTSQAGTDSPPPDVRLAGLDRTIAKEPRYATLPRYCLLAVGEDVATRIWLAFDGDALFVDADGDGDLTEPAERFARDPATGPGTGRSPTFEATFPRGSMPIERLVYSRPGDVDSGELLTFTLTTGRILMANWDTGGKLAFADSPARAPVVHVGGPLALAFLARVELTAGEEERLDAAIGTPGLGPGTFAAVKYYEIPEGLNPVVTLRFPGESTPAEVELRAPLDDRF